MTKEETLIGLLERIDNKLGFIVGEKVRAKHKKINPQVKELLTITTDYNEISRILGISPKYASSAIAKAKKRGP